MSRYTDQTLQGEQQQTIFIWYQSKTKRKDLDLTNKTPKKSEFIMQSKYWPPPSLSVLFFGQVWALDTQTSSCHRRLRFHRLRSTPKGIRRDHNFKGNSQKTLPKPNIYPQNFRYLSKYLPLIALIHIASVVACGFPLTDRRRRFAEFKRLTTRLGKKEQLIHAAVQRLRPHSLGSYGAPRGMLFNFKLYRIDVWWWTSLPPSRPARWLIVS